MKQSRLQRRGYSIAALRQMAARRLPRVVFDFVDGAAEDERTLRASEEAFAEVTLWPRYLNGAGSRDTSLTLFGQRLSAPLIIGPTGLSGMLWPRGEAEAARAAGKFGTVYTMSHGSTLTIEEVAKEAPGPQWFQVFMYRDRGLTRAMAERAAAAGYTALVLTIDNQLLGQRERDLRNGFTIPPRVTLANCLEMARHLPWLATALRRPTIGFANYLSEERRDILSLGAYIADMLDPATNWDDVAWLRSVWNGPFLLKGVLHPEEARRAVGLGVDGLIVSNHGGRQLDSAPASLRALPAVTEAVGGRVPLLLDGGVRRGSDIAKALALGATACLIGRPHLWGLAVAGEAGVTQVLEIYRRELDRVMALAGWPTLAAIRRQDATLPGEPAPAAENGGVAVPVRRSA